MDFFSFGPHQGSVYRIFSTLKQTLGTFDGLQCGKGLNKMAVVFLSILHPEKSQNDIKAETFTFSIRSSHHSNTAQQL